MITLRSNTFNEIHWHVITLNTSTLKPKHIEYKSNFSYVRWRQLQSK